MDLAHNEAGLEALLEIMAGVRRPGARLLLGLGAVGDRTDELIDALGEIGAKGSDVVAIGHKERYLRGRTMDEIDGLLRAGAARVGVTDIDTYPTEVECLAALVARAEPGDVVGLMCHAERQEAYDWIAAHGGTPDTPETLSEKVPRRPHARLSVASDVPGIDLLARGTDVEVALDDHRRHPGRRARLVHLARLPHRGLAGAETAYGPFRATHLGLAGEHDQQLAAGGRVTSDGAARRQRHGDQVGVGADPERAHREPTAAVGLDRAVGEVGQVQDPHAEPLRTRWRAACSPGRRTARRGCRPSPPAPRRTSSPAPT